MIKCIATVHNTPIANAPTSWLQYAMLDIFLAPTWYLLAIVPPSWSSCLSSFWKFPVCLSRSKLESKAWFSSASLYLSSSWGLIGLFGAPSTSRNVDISQCECASYEGSAISVLMWRYRDQKKSALGPDDKRHSRALYVEHKVGRKLVLQTRKRVLSVSIYLYQLISLFLV